MRILPVLAAACLTALCTPVLAQPAPTGSIQARLYAPMPAEAIAVEPAQDTDQYQRLKSAIEASLKERGYRISNDSQLVLEFYASEVLSNRIVDKPTGAHTQQSPIPGNERQMPSGIIDKLNDSLFGRRTGPTEGGEGTAPPPRQVHLSMTLTDWSASRRIWQGSAAGDLQGGDTYASTQALVPFLVGKLGMTADQEKFDLR